MILDIHERKKMEILYAEFLFITHPSFTVLNSVFNVTWLSQNGNATTYSTKCFSIIFFIDLNIRNFFSEEVSLLLSISKYPLLSLTLTYSKHFNNF